MKDSDILNPTMPFERSHAPHLDELNELFKDRYTFKTLIAIGGMGAVYLAKQNCLDRSVAVKILPRRYSRDSSFLDEFSQEAKIIARLNHHNLVAVYDFGVEGEFPFLVMEYAHGQAIDKLLSTDLIPYDRAAKLILGLCAGVKHAHKRGVVHRDIKPSNIILTSDGEIKLVDFGIAKKCGYIPYQEGDIIFGTEGFAAPEITNSPHLIDIRSDIYATGATLCQMITGFTPDKLIQQSEKKKLLGPLYPIVYKAIRTSPEKRYQNMQEFENALQLALKEDDHKKKHLTKTIQFKDSDANKQQSLFKQAGLSSSKERRKWLHERTLNPDAPTPVVLGGRYTLSKCLQQKSRTMVYLAKDALLERQVKVRLFFKSDFEQVASHFFEIFARLSRIEHSNIPKVLDGGLHDAGAFIVYDWGSKNLETNLLKMGDTTESYQHFAAQMLDALEVASHYGFYNHTLSPQSVVQDNKSLSNAHYILTDVGVSEILSLLHTNNTVLKCVCYEWAAPEQYQLNPQGEQTTLYLFSQMLITMILQGHPLAKMKPEEIKKEHQDGFRANVRNYEVNLSSSFCQWLDKLTEPDITQRFTSIRHARKSLQQL